MDVLLISPNKEMFPPAYPLGVSYLAQTLRDHGHTAHVLDLIGEDDEVSVIKKTIQDCKPGIIGFSIRNIDNCQRNVPKLYYTIYKEFIDAAKEVSDVPLVLGGAGFSIFPGELLRYYDVEYGFVGEGEVSFRTFIERMEKGENFSDINGLAIHRNGHVEISRHRTDQDFKTLPFPQREEQFLDHYRPDGQRWVNLQSKRGCDQKCIYCVYPYLEGCTLRMREADSIGRELEYLYGRMDVKQLSFVDGVFNAPPHHALAICDQMIERGIDMSWEAAFSPHPQCLPPELVTKLKQSGCSTADFSGTDAASKTMLKKMRKSYTQEDLIESSKRCKSGGLKVIHSLLLGGPGETLDSVKESLELMEKVEPDTLWVSMGIRIYPNTMVHKVALEEGVIKPDDNLLTPHFYLSPEVRDRDWRGIIQGYRERYPHWALTCLAENYSGWVSEIVKYAEVVQ
jgi:radical SAM superfamily enzyme YgiQ (UPF0313 family)